MNRFNRTVKEAAFFPTDSFISEINEYSRIINGQNLSVYISTDDTNLIEEIDKKYLQILIFYDGVIIIRNYGSLTLTKKLKFSKNFFPYFFFIS